MTFVRWIDGDLGDPPTGELNHPGSWLSTLPKTHIFETIKMMGFWKSGISKLPGGDVQVRAVSFRGGNM